MLLSKLNKFLISSRRKLIREKKKITSRETGHMDIYYVNSIRISYEEHLLINQCMNYQCIQMDQCINVFTSMYQCIYIALTRIYVILRRKYIALVPAS